MRLQPALGGGGGWVHPEKLGGGGGGRCAARFLKPLPYFRPNSAIFPTQFQTWPKIWYLVSDLFSDLFQLLIWEGLLLMVLSPNDEEVASSQKT